MSDEELKATYKLFVTKSALKQGQKLPLSRKALKEVIEQCKRLKFWPHNKEEFNFEPFYGALKFSFDFVEGHWIRVFAFADDFRKLMWVIRVTDKKTNKVPVADRIAVENAISEIERENQLLKKQRENERVNLKSIKGGKSE